MNQSRLFVVDDVDIPWTHIIGNMIHFLHYRHLYVMISLHPSLDLDQEV